MKFPCNLNPITHCVDCGKKSLLLFTSVRLILILMQIIDSKATNPFNYYMNLLFFVKAEMFVVFSDFHCVLIKWLMENILIKTL